MEDLNWTRDILMPGEYVLWTGMPQNGKLLTKGDIFLIPFSLLWGGFAIFWETTVLLTDSPLVFKLFGIPFVLVGLYIMFGRFIYASYLNKRTYYAVTDRRLIRKAGKKVDALSIIGRTDMHITYGSNDTGTITFGENQWNAFYGTFNFFRFANKTFSFDNISEVSRVAQIITDASVPR